MGVAVVNLADSEGHSYQVLAQSHPRSCGPTAIAMIVGRYKGIVLDDSSESLVQSASIMFPGSIWTQFDGSGTSGGNLYRTLEVMLGTQIPMRNVSERPAGGPLTVDLRRIKKDRPALVLVGWYDAQGNRVGGHFIVAAGSTAKGIVFLDPWQELTPKRGGELNETVNNGRYQGNGIIELIVYTGSH